jgi:hypothetical protein
MCVQAKAHRFNMIGSDGRPVWPSLAKMLKIVGLTFEVSAMLLIFFIFVRRGENIRASTIRATSRNSYSSYSEITKTVSNYGCVYFVREAVWQ